MLERAIGSVLAQNFVDWELIVMDDGSTDATPEFLRALQASWDRPQRLLCARQPNRGVSEARNQAAALGTAEWVALLDSDDEWMPDKLARQWELTADFRWIHGEEIWMRKGWRVNASPKHAKSGGRIFSRCVELCCVSASTVLVHAPLLHELGGFRADFPVCEDYDLWLKLAARFEAGFIAEPVTIKHGGHEDQLSRRFHSMDYYRAKALMPFLEDQSLSEVERLHVAGTVVEKSEILINGYRKHGQERNVGEVLSWRAQALSALTQLQIAHSAAESRPRSLDNLSL